MAKVKCSRPIPTKIARKCLCSATIEVARRPPVDSCCSTSLIKPRASKWRVILVTLAGASWLISEI